MRQLPTLQTYQPNYLGFAQAIDQKQQRTQEQNYLDTTRAQAATEHAEDRNYLTEQRAVQGEKDKRVTESQAIANAFKGGNAEQRTQIYKSMGGIGGITFVGKDVSIEYPDSVVTGPSAAVQEMAENIAKNPDYLDDPQTARWFTSQGGSIARKDIKAPTTRTIQRGRSKVTEEYNPKTKTWKTVGSGSMDAPKPVIQKDSRTKEKKNYDAGQKDEGFKNYLKEKSKVKDKSNKFGWVDQGDGTKIWSELKKGVTATASKTGVDRNKLTLPAAKAKYLSLGEKKLKIKSGGSELEQLAKSLGVAFNKDVDIKTPQGVAQLKEELTAIIDQQMEELNTTYNLGYGKKKAAPVPIQTPVVDENPVTHTFTLKDGLNPI